MQILCCLISLTSDEVRHDWKRCHSIILSIPPVVDSEPAIESLMYSVNESVGVSMIKELEARMISLRRVSKSTIASMKLLMILECEMVIPVK